MLDYVIETFIAFHILQDYTWLSFIGYMVIIPISIGKIQMHVFYLYSLNIIIRYNQNNRKFANDMRSSELIHNTINYNL